MVLTKILSTDQCLAFKTLTFDAPAMKEFESPTADDDKFKIWTMENKDRFKANAAFFGKMIFMWKNRAKIIQDLIHQTKPDLIIVEMLFNLPFITSMKYPWAMCVSTNPLKIANQIDYPPMGSGVSEDWQWYSDTFAKEQAKFLSLLDEFYREHGLERKPALCHIEPSPW